MLKDRLTRGLLAGFIAGIITKVYDLLTFYFGISTLRWFDFAGVMIYGKKPVTLEEQVFATLGVWSFHALLGIIFIFLIQRLISSGNLLLKGWFYGVMVWFLIYAISHLYKVSALASIPLMTSLSNFIGASIWGLLMALAVKWLDNKSKTSN